MTVIKLETVPRNGIFTTNGRLYTHVDGRIEEVTDLIHRQEVESGGWVGKSTSPEIEGLGAELLIASSVNDALREQIK